MIYYDNGDMMVRTMKQGDAQAITDEEIAQGWQASAEKYEMRLRDFDNGISVALVAEYHGRIAGYINVYFEAKEGPFSGGGYAEIVDFGVLEKYRGKGIGSKLMELAERIAAKHADAVCLGVGLHSGYGSAQRMYVKRGYIPDGSGAWYRNQVCEPYSDCKNDDDLILYFSKKLK